MQKVSSQKRSSFFAPNCFFFTISLLSPVSFRFSSSLVDLYCWNCYRSDGNLTGRSVGPRQRPKSISTVNRRLDRWTDQRTTGPTNRQVSSYSRFVVNKKPISAQCEGERGTEEVGLNRYQVQGKNSYLVYFALALPLSVCLSVFVSICLCVCLSVGLSLCQPIFSLCCDKKLMYDDVIIY